MAVYKNGVEQPTEEGRKTSAKILKWSKVALWISIAGLVGAIVAIIIAILY